MTRNAVPESVLLLADPDVLATEFGDEVVLLNLRDGVYYGLEGVGALIWRMLRRPVTMKAICDAIVEGYDVDRGRCERDVHSIIGNLTNHGLVSIRDDR
jgi:hypothetical protein